MLNEFKRFNGNLYKSGNRSSVRIPNQFLNVNFKMLDSEKREICEELLNDNEVKTVFKVIDTKKYPASNVYPDPISVNIL